MIFHGDALASSDANGQRESAFIASIGGRAPNLRDLANRAAIPPRFLADVNGIMTLGTTLVITDTPVDARTHNAPGFNILTDNLKIHEQRRSRIFRV